MFRPLQVKLGVRHLGPVLALLQLLLGVAELCQVERGDLLGLLNLPLVGLYLRLELVGELRHPVLVFLILIDLERKLLGAALRLLEALGVVSGLGLNIAKLNLKLPGEK